MLSRLLCLWISVILLITVAEAKQHHESKHSSRAAPVASWGLQCRESEMTQIVVGDVSVRVVARSVPFWRRVDEIMDRWNFVPGAGTSSYDCVRTGDDPKSWGLSVTLGQQPAADRGMIEEIESIRMTGDRTRKCFEWTASSRTLTFQLTPDQANNGVASDDCMSQGRPGKCKQSSQCRGEKVSGLCAGPSTVQCCLFPPGQAVQEQLRAESDLEGQARQYEEWKNAQQQREERVAVAISRSEPADNELATAFVESEVEQQLDADESLVLSHHHSRQHKGKSSTRRGRRQHESETESTAARAEPADNELATAFVESEVGQQLNADEGLLSSHHRSKQHKGKASTRRQKSKAKTESTSPVIPDSLLWPNRVVKWAFWRGGSFQSDSDLTNVRPDAEARRQARFDTPSDREAIIWRQGIDYWTRRSPCVTFQEVPINAVGHKLLVVGNHTATGHCAAYTGTATIYAYEHLTFSAVYIDFDKCHHGNALIHEIGHLLGMLHTMSRNDRAAYINVFASNSPQANQFDISSWRNGGTWQYGSVMDYPAWAQFPNGTWVKVVDAIQPPVATNEDAFAGGMGQHVTDNTWATDNDVAIIHRLYGCDPHLACPEQATACWNRSRLIESRIANGGNDCRAAWAAITPQSCLRFCQSYTAAPREANCSIPATPKPADHIVVLRPGVTAQLTAVPWSWPPDFSDHNADERFPNAWPCSVSGVVGKCMPTSNCTDVGGRFTGGSCPGRSMMQCCHTGRSRALIPASIPAQTPAQLCWGPLKGTCTTAADCSTAKGTRQAGGSCSGGKICCRHAAFPVACHSPRNWACRAAWVNLPSP